ncbi:MAG TPA: hypothetical protein VGA36_11165 [Nitriliruptorales bacterium]
MPTDERPSDVRDAAETRPQRVAALLGRTSRRAGRNVARRVDGLFSAGGPAFRDLAVAHAGSTAGDTLVAFALAGTLFFSVPSSEARGNVALYLLLTIAPFAIIGPVLGYVLGRFPTAYRHGLTTSAAVRALLGLVLIAHLESFWLFPLAFGGLVLSRTHGISRNALLPVVLDAPLALVAANAKLAQVAVLAGAAVAPVGVLALWFAGPGPALVLAAIAFGVAAAAGARLPAPPRPSDPAEAAELRRVLRTVKLPRSVRLAQLATAGARLLNGFLLLLLAFAFRDVEGGALEFGALLAAAGLGFGLSSITSPWLERRLREEPMVLAGLAIEAGAAFVAAQWFGLPAAAALAAAAGYAWGTAKFAFDGLLQDALRPVDRGIAFTRSETLFQLAWVVGAFLPTAIPVPADVGLVIAGLAALGAQVVYVAALIVPLRQQSARDRRR